MRNLSSLAIDGNVDVPIRSNMVLDKHVHLGEALLECLGPVAGPAGKVRAGILGQPITVAHVVGVVCREAEAQHARPMGAQVSDAERHSLPQMHRPVAE